MFSVLCNNSDRKWLFNALTFASSLGILRMIIHEKTCLTAILTSSIKPSLLFSIFCFVLYFQMILTSAYIVNYTFRLCLSVGSFIFGVCFVNINSSSFLSSNRLITPFVLGSMCVGLNSLIRHSFMDL